MHRIVRHTGEIKKDMDAPDPGAKTAGDGSGEHRTFGIETRVLVAAGLLGVLTYGMFAHDPVPRKPRPKARGPFVDGLAFGGAKAGDSGYARRKIEEDIEREVDAAEEEIDEEFEHTDLDEDELDVDEDEDEEDED